MSFTIQKNLTKYNFTDRNDISRIKYIVIHYFGSLGSAKQVGDYFAGAYRGASAHYALDDDEIIWQSVEDEDIAWHCGTSGTYFHKYCRNSNSLGIEVRPYKRSTATMSASDTDWYFHEATVDRLVEFTKYLMKKYNVPVDRVVRHYDVTHKICPNPYCVNAAANAAWANFKARLVEEDDDMAKVIEQIAISAGCSTAEAIKRLGLMVKFQDESLDQYQRDGVQKLKELGFISVERDGRAQVNWGDMGTVLGRIYEKTK